MSSARTEKVLPLSPAWAAMMEAFRARRFVSPAISSMAWRTSPIRAECSARAVAASPAPETAPRISCIPASVPETAALSRDDGRRDPLGEACGGLGLPVRLGGGGADRAGRPGRLAGEAGEVLERPTRLPAGPRRRLRAALAAVSSTKVRSWSRLRDDLRDRGRHLVEGGARVLGGAGEGLHRLAQRPDRRVRAAHRRRGLLRPRVLHGGGEGEVAPSVVRSRATPETASERRANEARIRSIATIRPWSASASAASPDRARAARERVRSPAEARWSASRVASRARSAAPSREPARAPRRPPRENARRDRPERRGEGREREGEEPEQDDRRRRARWKARSLDRDGAFVDAAGIDPDATLPRLPDRPSGSATEPLTVPLDLPETLARVRSAVDARLPELLERGPSSGSSTTCRSPLSPAAREALLSPGKRVRPGLVFLAAISSARRRRGSSTRLVAPSR